MGAHVHIIYFTHQQSIATWLLTKVDSFENVASTTCVTTLDEYLDAARSLRTYSIIIGQLRTRDYCIAEEMLRAEGIVPVRRILNAPVLTSEFLRWASENQFDAVIDLSRDISQVADRLHTALTSEHGTAQISFPLVSGSLSYRDAFDESIVQFISIGFTNAEIAEHLNFSLQTVRNRVSHILEESGARNRTHLAAMYLIPHALNLYRAPKVDHSSTTPEEPLTL